MHVQACIYVYIYNMTIFIYDKLPKNREKVAIIYLHRN